MSVQVQFRRGNTAQHSTFTGAPGEITVDTDKNVIVVHDGVKASGYPLAPNISFDVANAAFNISNTLSGNLVNVSASSNNYAGFMANSANGFASTIVNANLVTARAYTNTSTESANNYAGVMANGAGVISNAAFAAANQAGVIANAAFASSNSEYSFSNLVYDAVNSVFSVANAAYGNANSVSVSANNYAGFMANSANAYAASLTPDLSPAFNKANNALANTSGVSFAGNLFFPTGNVGIGTTSTNNKLEVIGNSYLNGNVTTGLLKHSPVPISKLLTAFDAADSDVFGAGAGALSGDGSVLAIGAPSWEGATGTSRGGVYIYDWNGSAWIQRGSILEAPDAADSDNFGIGVSLSSNGSILAVGAYTWEGTTGADRGGVYIYDWNGSAWIQRGSVLEASDAADSDLFGISVSLSSNGSILAVGAGSWEGATGTGRGGVYIYDWNGSSWVQRGSVLEASDAADNDNFGRVSLSSNGSILAVGAGSWEGATGTGRGGVYIFDWNGSAWIQRGSVLEASDAADSDNFGRVSLSGDGSVLAVGATSWEGATGTGRGGVYIFDWNGSSWVQRGSVLEAADAADSDNFGSIASLSFDGSVMIVTASNWEGSTGTNRGAVYTYTLTGALPSYTGESTGSGWIEGSNSSLIARTAGLDRVTIDSNGVVNVAGPTLLVAGQNVLSLISTVGASSNAYSNTVGTAGNNYTNTVGAASNNYAGSMANSANGFASTIVDSNLVTARAYTNTSTEAANNYAGVMANGAGLIANAAFSAANQAGVVANNANTYADATYVKKSGDTITGDLVVQGNVTISGNTTYANSQTLLIGDSLITLNNDIPTDVSPSEDSGIEIKRGSAANVGLIWNEGSDKWTFTNDGTIYRLIASNTDVESANNYAGAMANAANGYASTIVAANLDTARAYTNTSTTAANNYAGVMANSANAYAASLTPDLSPAFNKANSAYLVANAAFDKANNSGVNVSTTGPTNNTNGTLWFNSNLGRLFVYYTDVDSSQWIEASPSSGSVDVGLLQAYTNAAADLAVLSYNQSNTAFNRVNVVFGVTNAAFGIANVGNAAFGVTNAAFGVANAAFGVTNTSFGVANAAFNAANNRLANSTVTLAGTLTTTGAVVDSKGDTRDIPPTDRTSSMPYALTISDTGKMVVANGNTAATANIFVPNAIFAIGNTIMITNQSTSNVTITQNSSVTMFLAGNAAASGNRTLAGKGIATLICVGANNFIISGAGLT